MPEARISSSSKSVRYTIKELIKANNMGKTEIQDNMDFTAENISSASHHTRSYSPLRNSECSDILSSHEETKASNNETKASNNSSKISQQQIKKQIAPVQKQNSYITGSSGNVFH